MSKSTIGFIGLGNIGKPMAARLLGQGYHVVSCAHVRREAIEELKAVGLTEVASPREVARTTDMVMTMVRDTAESESVILGDQGVLAGMRQGATLVIMSTIYPDVCQRVATRAEAQGVAVLDAPVSGGPVAAGQGTLSLMVGGDAAVLAHCRPGLEALGRITHCGAVGMGMVTKLANNAVLFGTIGLVSEALTLGRAYGMPAEQLLEVFKHSSANSWTVQQWELLRGMWDHATGLGMKDVRTCLEVANTKDVKMPLTTVTGDYDWSAST